MRDRFKFRCFYRDNMYNCGVMHGQGFDQEYKELNHEDQISVAFTGGILMQCTGLKDKNGKLIYEGDIFNIGDDHILNVVFYEESPCFMLQFGTGPDTGLPRRRQLSTAFTDYFEIIGNIHENPELTNESEK